MKFILLTIVLIGLVSLSAAKKAQSTAVATKESVKPLQFGYGFGGYGLGGFGGYGLGGFGGYGLGYGLGYGYGLGGFGLGGIGFLGGRPNNGLTLEQIALIREILDLVDNTRPGPGGRSTTRRSTTRRRTSPRPGRSTTRNNGQLIRETANMQRGLSLVQNGLNLVTSAVNPLQPQSSRFSAISIIKQGTNQIRAAATALQQQQPNRPGRPGAGGRPGQRPNASANEVSQALAAILSDAATIDVEADSLIREFSNINVNTVPAGINRIQDLIDTISTEIQGLQNVIRNI